MSAISGTLVVVEDVAIVATGALTDVDDEGTVDCVRRTALVVDVTTRAMDFCSDVASAVAGTDARLVVTAGPRFVKAVVVAVAVVAVVVVVAIVIVVVVVAVVVVVVVVVVAEVVDGSPSVLSLNT